MGFVRRLLVPAAALVLAGAMPCAAGDAAEGAVAEAIARTPDAKMQARILADLAWPEVDSDPRVAEVARALIVRYADHGIAALRHVFPHVRPDQQADVARTMLETFARLSGGLPPDYLGGLDEVAWFGTSDARRTVIPELGRHRYRPSVLTIIDTAYEYPELAQICIEALGRVGDDRARFFLERVLNEEPANATTAAAALAQIGGRALLALKAAVRSQDPATRVAAVRSLMSVATPYDVSALHEYVALHPDDDPALLAAVRESAVALEKQLRAAEAAGAASATPEP